MPGTGRRDEGAPARAPDRAARGAAGAGRPVLAALALSVALAGCIGGGGQDGPADPAVGSATSVRLVDRDVEAPEVFQVTEQGLWDGRPSLGGVWVAHPDTTDPERVIIRNPANGNFVIGALFRRERDMPGPKLQISSDAAGALGLLAGQPAQVQVTALRRVESEGAAEAAAPAPTDVAGAAAAAIDRAEGTPPATTAAAPAAPPVAPAAPRVAPPPAAAPAAPASAPAAAPVGRQFVQIGIFSVEANAEKAAGQMRAAGLTPAVRREESQGKTFWRVVVGPLPATAERDAAIAKVKGLGYPDAYAVSK
ncbi:SPOR domain-containing protein [Frigidibacter oleivorans]|uniref:SPOR domain-containing protein n=1 Tax=Frigidibacter oleivorans TaxID=2487129 RepID=UPI000F8C8FC2|nr:SPOR domain-containing protein [Frigidibacter oleivorans]